MRRSFVFLALAFALTAGCDRPPPSPDESVPSGPLTATASVEELAAPRPAGSPVNYTGWPALTAEPVRLSPALFALCDVPADGRKLGPHFVPVARYYTNPEAVDAVRRGDAQVPVGTSVLKVKTWGEVAAGTDDSPAYALMVKREAGYDPAGGDWEYVYSSPQADGSYKTDRGRLESCAHCHRLAKDRDFLYRSYLKK